MIWRWAPMNWLPLEVTTRLGTCRERSSILPTPVRAICSAGTAEML
jgi:hypothetical protein